MIIPRDAWAVFRKDGLEVLRDRRTLFINLILPALLYPLMLLFMLQVKQLSEVQVRERPRIAVIGAPADLLRHLEHAAADTKKKTGSATAATARFELVEEIATAAQLSAVSAPLLADPSAGLEAKLDDTARREALRLIREGRFTAAIVVGPRSNGTIGIAILSDDANSRLGDVRGAITRATDAWRQELVERSLAAGGVDPAVLTPLRIQTPSLTPVAETMRTQGAAIIPYILVLLATVAAFHPAIDLMAGERERGTLETLMSLPGRRRDIIIGKLLVVCVSAFVAVLCNLVSLSISLLFMGSQLMAATGGIGIDLTGALSIGASTLALCFVVLSPVVVTIAALSIGLAGFAASVKEAQTWLTPMLLAVMFAVIVVMEPTIRPSYALDLVPITGAVLALKEALQSPTMPWDHLALATMASLAVAVVIVSWCTQLLEHERFRYPGLVRAGWGRWRKWWPANRSEQHAPGGPEALVVFAAAIAAMLLLPGFLTSTHPVILVAIPLLLCVAGPALLHAWIGAYDARQVFSLRNPGWSGVGAALLLLPAAIALSFGLGYLQSELVDTTHIQSGEDQLRRAFDGITAVGGLPLLIVCVGVLPGICEELLCRGTLLTGLRRSTGPAWAIVISAFLFAVMHMSPLRFMPQMALGVLLAAITIRSGSIIPAMIIHAGHNGIVVSLEYVGLLTTLPPVTALLVLPLGWVGWRLIGRKI